MSEAEARERFGAEHAQSRFSAADRAIFAKPFKAMEGVTPDLSRPISTLAVWDAEKPDHVCVRSVVGLTLPEVLMHYQGDLPFPLLYNSWRNGQLVFRARDNPGNRGSRKGESKGKSASNRQPTALDDSGDEGQRKRSRSSRNQRGREKGSGKVDGRRGYGKGSWNDGQRTAQMERERPRAGISERGRTLRKRSRDREPIARALSGPSRAGAGRARQGSGGGTEIGLNYDRPNICRHEEEPPPVPILGGGHGSSKGGRRDRREGQQPPALMPKVIGMMSSQSRRREVQVPWAKVNKGGKHAAKSFGTAASATESPTNRLRSPQPVARGSKDVEKPTGRLPKNDEKREAGRGRGEGQEDVAKSPGAAASTAKRPTQSLRLPEPVAASRKPARAAAGSSTTSDLPSAREFLRQCGWRGRSADEAAKILRELEDEQLRLEWRPPGPQDDVLFHGTACRLLQPILEKGFRTAPGAGGVAAAYFAGSKTCAWRYASKHGTQMYASDQRSPQLLLIEVRAAKRARNPNQFA